MSKKRRQYSSETRFKVALEAAKGNKTLAELSSDTGVHANQIGQWKAHPLDEGASLFQRNPDKSVRELHQQEAALYEQIGRPEIFNTDQGAQFTAQAFTDCLEGAGIRISMDGRGRALDNIFVERLKSMSRVACCARRSLYRLPTRDDARLWRRAKRGTGCAQPEV